MNTQEYIGFMFNKANIRNCGECPENREMKSADNENRYPCGQYNCWVDIHCRQAERRDD